jgi:hypothetical protein
MFRLRGTLHLLLLAIMLVSLSSLSIVQAAPPAQEGQLTVAILVVDDFGDIVDRTAPDDSNLCAMPHVGASYAAARLDTESVFDAPGEIMADALDELIDDLDTGWYMEIVGVSIEGRSTEAIASVIEDAINNTDADFYVASLNFALVPCDLLLDFAAFENQLAGATEQGNSDEMVAALLEFANLYADQLRSLSRSFSAGNDPLASLLARNPRLIGVAPAGDFGLEVPFYPGASPLVVSASASDEFEEFFTEEWDPSSNFPLLGAEESYDDGGPWVSNYGEVMLGGRYEDFAGTGLASVRLSFVVASYISGVGDGYCINNNGGLRLSSNNDFENLPLDVAAESFCSDLLSFWP